ncbi:hypothetical protein [Micromonospora sp. URMC 103]|uniref:hypothetical protein n=1 Tax=Micromonospora sp. URMC 103 TaxID=3423406 RepID=UPI003F1BFFA3
MSTSSRRSARRGAARPQASNVPAYSDSAGHEAIELARQAGLVGDEWQNNVIIDALGERPDGKWAAFEVGLLVGRQNGKGSVLEIRTLAGLTLFDERLILWSAHETKTAFEAFRRMVALFDGNDDLRRRVKKVSYAAGSEGIELTNGCRLRFVARTKGSGRGFTGDLIILDEAYAVTAEQMDALLPTLASRPNPQIWYTSSPPLDGASGDQLYALRERANAGAPGLAWFDWGLQGYDLEQLDSVDLDDPDLWAATNPAYGIRISEEFISRERQALSAEGFARERLGIWPRQIKGKSGVISDEVWRDQTDQHAGDPGAVVRPRDVVFVAQVSSNRMHTTIAAVGARQDGSLLASIVDHRPGTKWAPARLAELKRRHNPLFIVAQDKGPTGTLFTDLAELGITEAEDRERPRRGDLVVPWAADVAIAYGLFLDAVVDQKRLFHLDEAPLNVALAAASTRALSGGTAWDYTDPAVAPLLAVTLGTWAVLTVKLPPARRSAYEDDNGLMFV